MCKRAKGQPSSLDVFSSPWRGTFSGTVAIWESEGKKQLEGEA